MDTSTRGADKDDVSSSSSSVYKLPVGGTTASDEMEQPANLSTKGRIDGCAPTTLFHALSSSSAADSGNQGQQINGWSSSVYDAHPSRLLKETWGCDRKTCHAAIVLYPG